MFKIFSCFSAHEVLRPLQAIKKQEEGKKEGLRIAKNFISDLSDNLDIFRQFFDITPKVGVFGDMSHDVNLTTKLTCPNFVYGYEFIFVISLDSNVNGFSVTKDKEVFSD